MCVDITQPLPNKLCGETRNPKAGYSDHMVAEHRLEHTSPHLSVNPGKPVCIRHTTTSTIENG